MRALLLGVVTAVAVMAAPAAVSASPTPNGHNCVGVADSSLAGPGFGPGVVSPLARSAPGAVAATLGSFVNCGQTPQA
jgi:hypothetical protein